MQMTPQPKTKTCAPSQASCGWPSIVTNQAHQCSGLSDAFSCKTYSKMSCFESKCSSWPSPVLDCSSGQSSDCIQQWMARDCASAACFDGQLKITCTRCFQTVLSGCYLWWKLEHRFVCLSQSSLIKGLFSCFMCHTGSVMFCLQHVPLFHVAQQSSLYAGRCQEHAKIVMQAIIQGKHFHIKLLWIDKYIYCTNNFSKVNSSLSSTLENWHFIAKVLPVMGPLFQNPCQRSDL